MEIKETKAGKLSADEAETLLNWRNWTEESLVFGITMQGLLDLYHASWNYVSLEGWLDEADEAGKRYQAIRRKNLAPLADA